MTEMLRACSVQRRPDWHGDQHEQTNQQIVAQSNGQLAPVAQSSLKQFSLTCNHTCQAMRAGLYEAKCDDKTIAPNGTVSRALLEGRQPTFKKIFKEGIPWLQLHWIVEQEFPGIVRLIIAADNIPNAIAREDNTATLMLKCHQTAVQMMNEPDVADDDQKFWKDVELRVSRSELGRADDIPHIIAYCKDWSGGLKHPFILHEIDAYCKSVACLRDVEPALLDKLSKVDLGPACGALWRGAYIKFGLTATESKPLPSDISLMVSKKNRPLVLQADTYMATARALLSESTREREGVKAIDKVKAVQMLNFMDIRLVKHVLNKSKEYGTMKEICKAFHTAIAKLGSTALLPDEWVCVDKAKEQPKKRGVVELGVGGPSANAITQSFKEKSCEVGSHCSHAKTGKVYTVESIGEKDVVFKGIGDAKTYGDDFKMTIDIHNVLAVFNKFKPAPTEDVCLYIVAITRCFTKHSTSASFHWLLYRTTTHTCPRSYYCDDSYHNFSADGVADIRTQL
jgi:hypothetical protein